MWLKSHKWVCEPHFRTERRRELNAVRESRHTAMIFDRRYQDIDTGKFDTDRLPTIYSSALHEIAVEESSSADHLDYLYKRAKRPEEQAWFKPKDNDFDEECRREEEEKQQKEKQRLASAKHRLGEERKIQENIILERRKMELEELERQRQEAIERIRQREEEYAVILRDAEERAAEYQRLRMAHAPQPGKFVCNVRPNKWNPR